MYSSMVYTALNFISSELIAGYEIVRTPKAGRRFEANPLSHL